MIYLIPIIIGFLFYIAGAVTADQPRQPELRIQSKRPVMNNQPTGYPAGFV